MASRGGEGEGIYLLCRPRKNSDTRAGFVLVHIKERECLCEGANQDEEGFVMWRQGEVSDGAEEEPSGGSGVENEEVEERRGVPIRRIQLYLGIRSSSVKDLFFFNIDS